MEKWITGRLGFHPGGAEVRVEYVLARERMVLTCDIVCGVASSRSGFVLERVWVKDNSNSTRDFTHDRSDWRLLFGLVSASVALSLALSLSLSALILL